MFRTILMIAIKVLLVIIYLIAYMKISKARKMDPEMQIVFYTRSKVEVVVITLMNVLVFFVPMKDASSNYLLILGQVMLVMTYYHFNRYVLFGRKNAYLLEHHFRLTDLKSFTYSHGVMKVVIKGKGLKVRFPIGNMKLLEERLQGKRRK